MQALPGGPLESDVVQFHESHARCRGHVVRALVNPDPPRRNGQHVPVLSHGRAAGPHEIEVLEEIAPHCARRLVPGLFAACVLGADQNTVQEFAPVRADVNRTQAHQRIGLSLKYPEQEPRAGIEARHMGAKLPRPNACGVVLSNRGSASQCVQGSFASFGGSVSV